MTNTDEQVANYLAVFGALCLLTLVSVLADLLTLPSLEWVIAVIVLAVAAAKAGFVMLYFMHLKFETHWKYALLLPTIVLGLGMLLALMPDITLHYYTIDVPQVESQP